MSQTILPSDPSVSIGVLPRRFIALILDWILIGLLGWAAAFFIVIFGILTLGVGWLFFHIMPAIPFAYYTLLIGGSGATPGQRAMGLTVRQDVGLAHPTLPQAFVWSLLQAVSFVLACVTFLLMLLNPRHRAAHDILSGLTILRAGRIPY